MLNVVKKAVGKITDIFHYGFKGSRYRNATLQDLRSKEFLEQSIVRWKGSPERMMQIKGQLYYEGEHDILNRKRKACASAPWR